MPDYRIISKYLPGKGHSLHLEPQDLPKRLDLMLSMLEMSRFITIKETIRCQLYEELAGDFLNLFRLYHEQVKPGEALDMARLEEAWKLAINRAAAAPKESEQAPENPGQNG